MTFVSQHTLYIWPDAHYKEAPHTHALGFTQELVHLTPEPLGSQKVTLFDF